MNRGCEVSCKYCGCEVTEGGHLGVCSVFQAELKSQTRNNPDTKKAREFWLSGIHTIEPIIFDADETAKFRKDFNKDGEYIHVREVIEGEPIKLIDTSKMKDNIIGRALDRELKLTRERDKYKSLCEELAAALEAVRDNVCKSYEGNPSGCGCYACEGLAKYRKAVK